MTATIVPTTFDKAKIHRIFELQKAHQFNVANTSARERIAKLRKLEKALLEYRQEIRNAVYADARKPAMEADLVEIYPVINELHHTMRHLRRWMAPKRVASPLLLINSTSRIVHEPKGVVLIIAPWNFPILLTLGPLIAAIAAGNCVMIKPSEVSANASSILAKIIPTLFDENEVAIIEGDAEVAQALLELPFNHIFCTSSPAIGKIVMAAAAKNLTSVTLELGGKSPAIVDKNVNLDLAARRIAWSKFTNAGQTCIAPDYLFVHEDVKDAFLERIQQKMAHFFSENPQQSNNYGRLIALRHFERVKSYVDDAVAKGARVIKGGMYDAADHYIAPTLVMDVPLDSKLMQEEIFGPVLPVLVYKDLSEVITFINKTEKPLSLYIYSKNKRSIHQVINSTRSGAVSINHSEVHYFNFDLPFGGVNNSGIGKAHGWFGFEAFSNAKGIFQQNFWGGVELIMPPYTRIKQKLVDFLMKWI